MFNNFHVWNLLDSLNPLRHVSEAQYVACWQMLFATLLQGFWAKCLASVALVSSVLLSVWRQRVSLGIFLFMVAVVLAYGGGIVKYVLMLP